MNDPDAPLPYDRHHRIQPVDSLAARTGYVLRDGLYTPTSEPIMTIHDPTKTPAVDPAPNTTTPGSILDALNPPPWVKIALFVLGGLASLPPILAASGVAVPAVLVAISATVASVLGALGVVSNGLQKK